MPLAVDDLRADTPGVAHVFHLNNAGAALQPRPVLDAVRRHLDLEAQIGGYEAAEQAAPATAAVYESIARLIAARPHEIAIVDHATRAWDSVVHAFPFRAGDRVLTARAEYASNAIALLQLRRRHEIEIVLIDDDEHGQIDLDQLDAELARGAAMVSLTHVPTNGGLVNPAAQVGERCRAHGTFFMLDACQSAGQLPLDVEELGCDALSATGRKYLRGPRGTGLLYVREPWIDRLEPPMLDLHSATWTAADRYEARDDARRFEAWECSHALRLGLGAAAEYAAAVGPADAWDRLRDLAARLREQLAALPGVEVHDKGRVRGGIVTFTVAGQPAATVHAELRGAGINTSVTTPDHSQLDGRGLPPTVRASVHYYNTDDEVARLVDVVSSLVPAG